MKNSWFGKRVWAQICLSLEHVSTPVGEICLHCDEKIGEDDEGEMIFTSTGERPIHRECLLRTVIGSVGHQKKTCSCYGGSEEDPPNVTKREAAIAAVSYFEKFK